MRRSAKLAAALAASAIFTFAAPVAAPTLSFVSVAHAQQPAEFDQILAAYGTFQEHARYGRVWIPAREVAPEGWHPYPPCNWVHDRQLGWYFDDKTAWGKIVHHYGRWAHDAALGWVWVKGEEFSPAWVVWRTSDKWVGWAPMPPDVDVKEISATTFNTDKHWIFVEVAKFSARCGGETIVSAPPASYPSIFSVTRVVTDIRYVRGIAVFVLPPPLIINIVDIDIGIFPPWNPCFFGAWFWNWNWIVNTITININLPAQCPLAKKIIPIVSTPPPPPPGQTPKPDRRVELPPKPDRPIIPPRGFDPPRQSDPPRVFDPRPPVIIPPVRIPPVVAVPPKPDKPDHGGQRPPRNPETKPDKPTRPIDPGFNRHPLKPLKPEIVRPQFDPPKVIKDPPRRDTKPSFGNVIRQPVPKLVRTPQILRAHPQLTAPKAANLPQRGSNLR